MIDLRKKPRRIIHLGPGHLVTEQGRWPAYKPFHASVRWLSKRGPIMDRLMGTLDYAEAVLEMDGDERKAECLKRKIECDCASRNACVRRLLQGVIKPKTIESMVGFEPEEDPIEEEPEGDSNDYVLLEAAYSEDRYHDVLKLVNRLDPDYEGPKTKAEIYEHAEILLELAFGAPIDEEE